MAKSVRANLELASEKDVIAICKKDAPEVSSKPNDYVKANLLSAYVLINTWLLMIQQWSQYGWTFVLAYMKHYGLRQTIREFDTAAAQFIRGERMDYSCARTIWNDIQKNPVIAGVPGIEGRNVHSVSMSAALLLFRYGKRFSPLQADKLRAASLQNFVNMQKTLKEWQRRPTDGYVAPLIRESISSLLNWNDLCDELDAVDLTDIVFTPGVSFDTRADLVSKLRFVAKARVEYFPQPFGIPLVANKGEEEMTYWGKYSDYEYHTVRISAVPKNYKTARIIAPEDVVRQATARRYFQIMDRYTPSLIQLHDQSRNQEYAKWGSISGELATIDLSAASDSITWTLLCDVFPRRFLDIISRVLPNHYLYDGRVRRLESAATMGNSITFWLESVLFAGIAHAGTHFAEHFGAFADVPVSSIDAAISVYGDDIIIPTRGAITVIEWLEKCGFTVNADKSFFDSNSEKYYRESCGEEYYDGICVSSVYFPRFPLEGELGGQFSSKYHRDGFTGTRVNTMTSMIDLQHKMFGLCVPASILVAELVKEADPKMTSSTPDEDCQDLWSYESLPVVVPAPAGQWIDGKLRKLVVEGQVREAHSGSIYLVPKTVSNPNAEDQTLVNLYNYQQFLKHGPRYETPLDRLLGISAPPISYSEARLDGEIKWVLIK